MENKQEFHKNYLKEGNKQEFHKSYLADLKFLLNLENMKRKKEQDENFLHLLKREIDNTENKIMELIND